MCVCAEEHAILYMCGSGDNFVALVLSFHIYVHLVIDLSFTVLLFGGGVVVVAGDGDGDDDLFCFVLFVSVCVLLVLDTFL